MNPDEIKAARRELGFSTSQMAEWLGLELPNGERRIRDWESGRLVISGPAKRAIRLAVDSPAFPPAIVREMISACRAMQSKRRREIQKLEGKNAENEHLPSMQRRLERLDQAIEILSAQIPADAKKAPEAFRPPAPSRLPSSQISG